MQFAILVLPAEKRYTETMTAKEQVLRVIQDLPESSTWAEIEDRVRFVAAIEIGLDDVQAGRVVAHESVVRNLESWLPN